jgi:hypothetical protein
MMGSQKSYNGSMTAFIAPPKRIPFYLRIGIWIAKRATGKELLPARILAWYPNSAIGSGVLEALVAHKDGNLDERILKLVRMQASFAAACPFCIDMNSFQYENQGISPAELRVLQGREAVENVATFSEREKLAIQYARLISQTPLRFPLEIIEQII